MADKFELNSENVNQSIESITNAVNATVSQNIGIVSIDINNTTAFSKFDERLKTSKTIITSEFPKQFLVALRSISSKVEALKEMDEKLAKKINLSEPQNGQGGEKGFKNNER